MVRLRLPALKTDRRLAQAIRRHTTPGIEQAAGAATLLADEKAMAALVGGVWILAHALDREKAGEVDRVAAAFVVTWILPHVMKKAVSQERPDRCEVHGKRRGIPKSGNAYDAFPSGHAMHVGALAAGLSALFPRHSRLIWSAGFALAGTRLILLAHWLSDVLAGLTLGALIAAAIGPTRRR